MKNAIKRLKKIYDKLYYKIEWILPEWCSYPLGFLCYDIGLTLTGRQRGVEYVEAYLQKVVTLLEKIAIYDEPDRVQMIEKWENVVDTYLENISYKCNNLNDETRRKRQKRLRFKDYMYALSYMRIGHAKSELENADLVQRWRNIDLEGLTFEQQRVKICKMYDEKDRKVKFKEWNRKELHDIIYNLLKEEFREISKGGYVGINPFNPYYLQIERGDIVRQDENKASIKAYLFNDKSGKKLPSKNGIIEVAMSLSPKKADKAKEGD